ncbi:MAG: hypothetical protein AAF634_00510 [Bacteroidota bacterium]
MKRFFKWTGFLLLGILLMFLLWYYVKDPAVTLAEPKNVSVQFEGAFLALSDADMVATGYVDGKTKKLPELSDTLSYIEAVNGTMKITKSHFASNSVISWPAVLEWHTEFQYAYIAETRAALKNPNATFKDVFADFPTGEVISVIDFSKDQPQLLQTKTVGKNIQGVSINAKRDLIAFGSTEQGKELGIAFLEEGLLQDIHYFSHRDILPLATNNSGIRTVEFHPTKNILAVNLNNTYLVYYEVKIENHTLRAIELGKPIEVAKRWSVGNWHPSGDFFILTDVAWGNGVLGAIVNNPGYLVSVAFDRITKNEVISKVKVDLGPEGADISPDGKYAIAVNMRRTYVPSEGYGFVNAKAFSSLTLVKIDVNSGVLRRLGDHYGFEGALPEDAIFDKESNFIAVAVYHAIENPEAGWIDFWEIIDDRLVYTGQKIKVTRGVHNLLLID